MNSRKLIIHLLTPVLICSSSLATPDEKTKEKVELFGNFRFRATYAHAHMLNEDVTNHEDLYYLFRFQGGLTFNPTDYMSFTVGLAGEPKYTQLPDQAVPYTQDEFVVHALNAKIKPIPDVPLTLIAGRQDIRLGTKILVLEGNPGVQSRTIYFDALRAMWNTDDKKLTLDAAYIDNKAHSDRIKPINDQDVIISDQDERGAYFHATQKIGKKSELRGFFIYKHDYNPARAAGRIGDIYTPGIGCTLRSENDWEYFLEITPQFGECNDKDKESLAAYTYISHPLGNFANNRLQLGYEYRSGDKDRDLYFDPLWGRYPRWTDYYAKLSALDGRGGEMSNLHRAYVTWSIDPLKKLNCKLTYNALFADKIPDNVGTVSGDGCFRGHMFRLVTTYGAKSRLQHSLKLETFLPGEYYADNRQDQGFFARYELLAKW